MYRDSQHVKGKAVGYYVARLCLQRTPKHDGDDLPHRSFDLLIGAVRIINDGI
jgi:hypothetical protein